MRFLIILSIGLPGCLPGQQKLSLKSAVEQSLQQNKSIHASQASLREAEAHVRQARSSLLPKVEYSESLTRSDNPVFVFGSLLTQHQFTQSNFALNSLNRPAFLDNFQSQVTASETLFDAGRTRNEIRSALSRKDMAAQDERQVQVQTILDVVRGYFDAFLAGEALAAATKAIESAEADLSSAEEVRRVGMSTDADVLSIRVHLARIRQQQIRCQADLATAQATLNDAIGIPLETTYELTTAIRPFPVSAKTVEELEKSAVLHRPESLKMNSAGDAARTDVATVRSALMPKISVQGSFEDDRQDFFTRGGANWTGSVALAWNIFNGGADKARIEQANQTLARTQAEGDRISSSVRLDVRRAWQNLRAADQQIEVSKNIVAQAEETLRIVQNRYHAGLSTVTDLLRVESALLEARMQYLTSLHDQRLASIVLEAAAGTLSVDSPALQE